MTFENDKKTVLSKPDKSRIGEVDVAIRPLVDLINSKPQYYTTSSCAGRILLRRREGGKRHETAYFFISHDPVGLEDLRSVLGHLPDEEVIFHMEGLILHVCCEGMESAERLLNLAREAGFKRSGITSVSNKIIVEIIDTQRLELPIADKGKLLVPEEYISYLLEEANEKLEGTRKKMKNFSKGMS